MLWVLCYAFQIYLIDGRSICSILIIQVSWFVSAPRRNVHYTIDHCCNLGNCRPRPIARAAGPWSNEPFPRYRRVGLRAQVQRCHASQMHFNLHHAYVTVTYQKLWQIEALMRDMAFGFDKCRVPYLLVNAVE